MKTLKHIKIIASVLSVMLFFALSAPSWAYTSTQLNNVISLEKPEKPEKPKMPEGPRPPG